MPVRKFLTDLERRVYLQMSAEHHRRFPDAPFDPLYVGVLARVAVESLTTGSASARRVRAPASRTPDPGSSPASIRALARRIEDSFHTMPNGWVRADDQLGATYE